VKVSFVDIASWQSPVAQQFKLRSIPHLQVYGPDGTLAVEGSDAAVDRIEEECRALDGRRGEAAH
jgi:hypothetical protein